MSFCGSASSRAVSSQSLAHGTPSPCVLELVPTVVESPLLTVEALLILLPYAWPCTTDVATAAAEASVPYAIVGAAVPVMDMSCNRAEQLIASSLMDMPASPLFLLRWRRSALTLSKGFHPCSREMHALHWRETTSLCYCLARHSPIRGNCLWGGCPSGAHF